MKDRFIQQMQELLNTSDPERKKELEGEICSLIKTVMLAFNDSTTENYIKERLIAEVVNYVTEPVNTNKAVLEMQLAYFPAIILE